MKRPTPQPAPASYRNQEVRERCVSEAPGLLVMQRGAEPQILCPDGCGEYRSVYVMPGRHSVQVRDGRHVNCRGDEVGP